MEKQLPEILEEIKGTFLMQIFNCPDVPIYSSPLSDDKIIGEATELEKKCFSLYRINNFSEKYKENADVVNFKKDKEQTVFYSEMLAKASLEIMALLISERLKIKDKDINRVWMRDGGIIVLCKEKLAD